MVQVVHLVLVVHLVFQADQVLQVQMVHQELVGKTEQMVLVELTVLLVQMAHLVHQVQEMGFHLQEVLKYQVA